MGKWRDENTLRELYHGKGMDIYEIADVLGCKKSTVSKWLKKNEIKTRSNHLDSDHPLKDEKFLKKEYVEKQKSAIKIADMCGVGTTTVYNHMKSHGIERRSISKAKKIHATKTPAPFSTNKYGYEYWKTNSCGELGIVPVHRLLAVSEWGIEAVKGKVIHHKNRVPWDNRVQNLMPVTVGEHNRIHAED